MHGNDKISTIRSPLRLDFDAPSCTESVFSLFQICSINARLGGQKPPKLSPMDTSGSTKLKEERFRKHKKNVTTTASTNVTNMIQQEGPGKLFFCGFRGTHPRMVPRVSPGRLPGPKASQNGRLDIEFLLFWSMFSVILGPCFHLLLRHFGNLSCVP